MVTLEVFTHYILIDMRHYIAWGLVSVSVCSVIFFYSFFPNVVEAVICQVQPGDSSFHGALLDVDFVNNKAHLNGTETSIEALGFTIVRATPGWIDTKDGLWHIVPANTLRISDRGVLIEGKRVFAALYNRDLTASVWIKTNMTVSHEATGIDGVPNSASIVTAAADNATVLQQLKLNSSIRSQSAFVKRVTGSGPIFMTMDGGATWTEVTAQDTWSWVEIPSQTLANPKVGFKVQNAGDVFAIDFVLNENGPFKTSPMEVLGRSVTRDQDQVTLELQHLGVNFDVVKGSVLIKFDSNQDAVGVTMLSLHTVSGDDTQRVSFNGNAITDHYGMTTMANSVGQGLDPLMPFVKGKHIFVASMNAPTTSGSVALDGSDIRSNSKIKTWPTSLNYLVLGGSYGRGGPPGNMYIQEFALDKNILSDAEVKELSKLTP